MTDITVLDVSEFQGVIDWPKVRADGYEAVILRAHNGYREDNRWAANAAAVSKLFPWWGAYQYLPASKDPRAAAAAFTATLGAYKPNLVVLDLEEGSGDQGPRQQAWLGAMNHGPEWTYSGLYFARSHGLTNVQWIAAYSQVSEPTVWHELWQYTGGGRSVPGIAGGVDASTFHGTLDDLITLTGGTMSLPQSDLDAISADILSSQLGASTIENGKPLTVAIALDRVYGSVAEIRAQVDAMKAEVDALKSGAATVDVEAIAEAVFQRFKAQVDKA